MCRDNRLADPAPDKDEVFLITSAYRPPAAAVELARKNFDKPVEIHATKPEYDRVGYRPPFENWKPGDPRQPKYWETTYIGRTFQMGSCVSDRPDVPEEVLTANLLPCHSANFFSNSMPCGPVQ